MQQERVGTVLRHAAGGAAHADRTFAHPPALLYLYE